MIKEFLTETLPTHLRLPDPPARAPRSPWEIFGFILLLAVVCLLSGWFAAGWALFWSLMVSPTLWYFWAFREKISGKHACAAAVIFIVVASVVALLHLRRSHEYGDFSVSDLASAGFFGALVATAYVEAAERPRYDQRVRELLMKLSRQCRGPRGMRFPFQSTNGDTLWAIDPENRSLRVVAMGLNDLDRIVQWDEPIRGVEVRRVGRVLDCELLVRSGRSKANEWTYCFEVSSAYRAEASRWRATFEGWMNEDKERSA